VRIVWSFWNKPFEDFKPGQAPAWTDQKSHLLSWILSVMTASEHYGDDTQLVTDDAGEKLLVNTLGIPFRHVTKQLNEISDYDPAWWALGKIKAYRAMDVPFVHIDSDVFLWSRLPKELEEAPVLGQNPEYFVIGDRSTYGSYIPERLETSLLYENQGWLPKEWLWYRAVFTNQLSAVCCGIYGGTKLEFIHHCADLALSILNHPTNKEVFKAMDGQTKDLYIMLLEQFLPVACMEYHCDNKFSRFNNIRFKYLFHSIEDAYYRAFRTGFTHLISDSKRHLRVLQRLEPLVKKNYEHQWEKLESWWLTRAKR